MDQVISMRRCNTYDKDRRGNLRHGPMRGYAGTDMPGTGAIPGFEIVLYI